MRTKTFYKIIVASGLLGVQWVMNVAQAQSPTVATGDAMETASALQPGQAAQFDLLELRVKGNTILPKGEIERLVYPYLGPHKSLDTVEEARTALEKLYTSKGYQTVAVDIPEQNVVNGVVYLQVVEGKVARLRVTDSHYFSLGAIKAKVPELAEGNVPNLPKMQEQLVALAKESPDRSVTPVLRAGDTPGTLEVDLKVQDELPLHGKIEVNGRNTTSTERLRAIASLRYDNLWQKFHSASLMYQVTPEKPDQVEVFVGSYVMPIIDENKRLALFAVSSSSNSVANAGAMTIVGNGDMYGLRFVNPIKTSSRQYMHTVTAGVTYKDFQQNISGLNVGPLFERTPITYLPFLLGYTGNMREEDYSLLFNLNANFSFRNFANKQLEFSRSRYHAKANYAYLSGDLDFKHNLPLGMEFVGQFDGQIAQSPLISNEQFSLGGQQSVRGYYESQVLADDAVRASFELYSPKVELPSWEGEHDVKGLVFFDVARGWVRDVLNQQPSQYDLVSVGTGLRMRLWKKLVANFDVGVPFTSQTRVDSGDPRFHFQVYTEF